MFSVCKSSADYFGGHAEEAPARRQYNLLRTTWEELNVPTKEPKCTSPRPALDYLGWTFNTELKFERAAVDGGLQVTKRRLTRYIDGLDAVLASCAASRGVAERQLCSLVGQVRSTELVFPYLAPWVRRIEYVTAFSADLSRRIIPNRHIQDDLRYIRRILGDPTRNRISFDWLLTRSVASAESDVLVLTDASGTKGVGGYVAMRDGPSPVFRRMWADTCIARQRARGVCAKPDITFLEMLGVVLAARLYGHTWRGKTVRFKCDNMATCYCVGKKCACFKRLDLNWLLKELCGIAHQHRFHFWIVHIKGERNNVADALSRLYEITPEMVRTEQVPFAISLSLNETPCAAAVDHYLNNAFYSNLAGLRARGVATCRCACSEVSIRFGRNCKRITKDKDCVFAQWR